MHFLAILRIIEYIESWHSFPFTTMVPKTLFINRVRTYMYMYIMCIRHLLNQKEPKRNNKFKFSASWDMRCQILIWYFEHVYKSWKTRIYICTQSNLASFSSLLASWPSSGEGQRNLLKAMRLKKRPTFDCVRDIPLGKDIIASLHNVVCSRYWSM